MHSESPAALKALVYQLLLLYNSEYCLVQCTKRVYI